MRGRGFGFVKMAFKDEEEANKVKEQIISQNSYPGHHILDKQVDVKSADDYHEKKQPMLGGFGAAFPPMGAALPGAPLLGMVGPPGLQKPNPYAIPEAK